MPYSHFNREIPADIDHLPEIEQELRLVQKELQEIGIIIARQKNTALRNTILSAIFAIGGIIGAYKNQTMKKYFMQVVQ